MVHTLLTFTPLQDTREDGQRDLLTCAPLTQTFGPIPLASLDNNGWVIWEQKLALIDGNQLQLAPVTGDRVMPATQCFTLQGRQQAIKINVVKDTQNPLLYYLQMEPMGSTPVSALNNTMRISANAGQNQPIPSLQIASVRDKYLTSGQTFSLVIIGTVDTRIGRDSKIVLGNSVTVWAEQDALHLEWPAV